MHDIILKRLPSLYGLSSERELSNFLGGLRPTAKCLWRAYQANVVNVSYREETIQVEKRPFRQHTCSVTFHIMQKSLALHLTNCIGREFYHFRRNFSM